jgi:hypothetical protein
MVRSRKFKERLNQPPHRRLTKEEVEHIAREGGIDFGSRTEEFSEFEEALEFIRCRYKPEADWKRLSLTDSQIRDRLIKMRTLARQLHELLNDRAFNLQTHLLIEGEDEPWGQETSNRELALVMEMACWAELGLKKLKERSARCPNDWAIPAAAKPGLNQLLAYKRVERGRAPI